MPNPDRREFLAAGVAAVACPALAVPARERTSDPFPLPAGVVARFGSPRFRHPESVHEMWFSPRGSVLYVETITRLWAWETETARPIRSWPLGSLGLLAGWFGDDGRVTRLAVGDYHNVMLWSCDPTTAVPALSPCGVTYYDGANYASGHRVFAVADRDQVRLIASPSGRLIWATRVPALVEAEPAFSPNGRWLAVIAQKNVVVLDARTGWRVFTVSHRASQQVRVTFDAASRQMAVGHAGLTILDLTTGAARVVTRSSVFAPHFTRGGAGVLALADDGRVTEWDAAAGQVLRALAVPAVAWQTPCVSADGTRLASHSSGGTVLLSDLVTGNPLPQSADPAGEVHGLRFGPAGRLVAAVGPGAGPDEWVGWDSVTAAARRVAPADASWLVVGLSPDEKLFATLPQADGASGFDLHDAATGRLVRRLAVPRTEESGRGTFSGDGRRFVAAGSRSAFAWELRGGRRKRVPLGANAAPEAVVASHDGRLAAVVRDDPAAVPPVRRSVVVVDFARGAVASRFTVAVDAEAGGLAFAPDGSRFGALEPDDGDPETEVDRNTLVVHDPATGAELARLPFDADYGPNDPWFAFAPDGRSVVTADGDGTAAAVRELATGGVRTTLRHAGPVTGAAFTPDGRRLAVASYEAPVYLWDYRGDRIPVTRFDPTGLWADLASRDAGAAFRAVTLLARIPDAAVPFLQSKLSPTAAADSANVRKLVGQLGAADYRARDAATTRLRLLADRAGSLLREAQSAARSAEVRRRLDDLLDGRTHTPEQLRAMRVVEVLEWVGPAARPVLAAWAGGVAGARLTTEAAAALRRLGPG